MAYFGTTNYNNITLASFSAVFLFFGFFFLIALAKKNGMLDFLTPAHWYSLVIMVIAGILAWVSYVWILHPEGFKVNKKQWISLVFSILISVLLWARYSYTVDDSDEEGDIDVKK